jgi:hypothetical protein
MGAIFKFPAMLIYFVGGFWGFFITMGIVIDKLGFIGGAIAFFIAPFTLYFAPWYEAIANANWFPVILVYGSTAVAGVLYMIGTMIDGDR